ncbi:MAG: aminoacyl-tRNA hydrolase [Schwartzia sp.]|nr:aminoacyl-tRNA hydrolase [Schwartzia sp. (in: firmicutes)]
MKMFAGLGNPGAEYAATRHNVGFMLVDALASRWDAASWRLKQDALVAEARLGTEKVLLVKPMTYMNESGRAVGPLLSWYKLEASNLIVAHDDMDLPVGTIRLRKKGSAGGHNGMKSILYHVQNENFPRVRIGVGHPVHGRDQVIRHVLSPFSGEDAQKIRKVIDYLLPAVECILTEGIDLAMNKYNPKKEKKPKPSKNTEEQPAQNEANESDRSDESMEQTERSGNSDG